MPRLEFPRRPILILLTLAMIPLSWYSAQLFALHRNLTINTFHRHKISDGYEARLELGLSKTLPPDLVQRKSDYIVLYDDAARIGTAGDLPDWGDRELLTEYLRHNMGNFASLPQAWILWAMAEKSHRKTFDQEWISKLKFEKGDRVCGNYVVVRRGPADIEFSMSLGDPGSDEFIEGRLIISIRIFKEADPDGAFFRTNTLMWRKKSSKTIMPLERRVPRWIHQITSWWLIARGMDHLKELGKSGK